MHTHSLRAGTHPHTLPLCTHTFPICTCCVTALPSAAWDPPGSPPLAQVRVGTSPSFFLPSSGGEGHHTNSLPPLRKTPVRGGRGEESKVSFNCHHFLQFSAGPSCCHSLGERFNPLDSLVCKMDLTLQHSRLQDVSGLR